MVWEQLVILYHHGVTLLMYKLRMLVLNRALEHSVDNDTIPCKMKMRHRGRELLDYLLICQFIHCFRMYLLSIDDDGANHSVNLGGKYE